jgi:glyoxylase-like metal-dependent hydrolase (beta-lactamase superfamily II)
LLKKFPYQLTENIYVLGNPYFFTYLVKDKPCALLDLNISGAVPLILQQLHELGVSPSEIGYLAILHAHFDHVGLIPYFKQISPGVKVVGSVKASEVLAKPGIIANMRKIDEDASKFLKEMGIFKDIPPLIPYQTLEVDVVVKDGDHLFLENTDIEFMATLGHSPCSLSAYLPKEKVAFISDVLGFYLFEENIVTPSFSQSVKNCLDSAARLSALNIEVLGTGHWSVFNGRDKIQNYFRLAIQGIHQLKNDLKQMAANGASEEKLLDRVMEATYLGPMVIYPPEHIRLLNRFMIKPALEAD